MLTSPTQKIWINHCPEKEEALPYGNETETVKETIDPALYS